jgi:uncharacterized protein (DUF1810 family)
MTDPYNLRRFVDAQNRVFDDVCAELRNGSKRGHWMWYIFPQIKGLGYSQESQKFAISSRKEAEAYMQHTVLGPRLRKCTQLVMLAPISSIVAIFSHPDDLKFRSSMTLFAQVSPDKLFCEALQKYFNGEVDQFTIEHL